MSAEREPAASTPPIAPSAPEPARYAEGDLRVPHAAAAVAGLITGAQGALAVEHIGSSAVPARG